MIKKGLFLDDVRTDPNQFVGYEEDPTQWTIVKSFDTFVEYLQNNPLPDVISFDHDLADEHYNNAQVVYSDYKEKTGLSAARYLHNFLLETKQPPPEIRVHSMNPVGRRNIEAYFQGNGYKLWKFNTGPMW